MRYRDTGEYEQISQFTSLVLFNEEEYNLEDFDCGIDDYNNFIKHDANYYIQNSISSVHLLIHNDTKEVIGYLALLTDAFLLDKSEREKLDLDIPFSSVPAMKVGKLAVSKKFKEDGFHYGCFLLELCLGKAEQLIEAGVACRFLTVDADIEYNPDTPSFYEKNSFVRNEHRNVKNRKGSVSLRYDLFLE